ncbi:unnamed protein product [Closterium sp. Naga37s-1]|nr:unnamed protein product [Closterium sp. Naga37s-1]
MAVRLPPRRHVGSPRGPAAAIAASLTAAPLLLLFMSFALLPSPALCQYSTIGLPVAIVGGGVYDPLTGDTTSQVWEINLRTRREIGYSSKADSNANAQLTSCGVATDGTAYLSSGGSYLNAINYTLDGAVPLPPVALPGGFSGTVVALGGPSENLLVVADGSETAAGAVSVDRVTGSSRKLVGAGYQCLSASFCSSPAASPSDFLVLTCHVTADDSDVVVVVPIDPTTGNFQANAAIKMFSASYAARQAVCSPGGGFLAILRYDTNILYTYALPLAGTALPPPLSTTVLTTGTPGSLGVDPQNKNVLVTSAANYGGTSTLMASRGATFLGTMDAIGYTEAGGCASAAYLGSFQYSTAAYDGGELAVYPSSPALALLALPEGVYAMALAADGAIDTDTTGFVPLGGTESGSSFFSSAVCVQKFVANRSPPSPPPPSPPPPRPPPPRPPPSPPPPPNPPSPPKPPPPSPPPKPPPSPPPPPKPPSPPPPPKPPSPPPKPPPPSPPPKPPPSPPKPPPPRPPPSASSPSSSVSPRHHWNGDRSIRQHRHRHFRSAQFPPSSTCLFPAPSARFFPASTCRVAPSARRFPASTCRVAPSARRFPASTCRVAPSARRFPASTCSVAPSARRLPASTCRFSPSARRLPSSTCPVSPSAAVLPSPVSPSLATSHPPSSPSPCQLSASSCVFSTTPCGFPTSPVASARASGLEHSLPASPSSAATCKLGVRQKCLTRLVCQDALDVGGCSCLREAGSPSCTITRKCMVPAACPVEALCTSPTDGSPPTCSCPAGFAPLKAAVEDTAFDFCARTRCSSSLAFIGFDCGTAAKLRDLIEAESSSGDLSELQHFN